MSFKIPLSISIFAFLFAASVRAQETPLYHETYRPQFHFTAAKDWLNDPNGMVFYQGEYHLFFQRTPNSLESGIKTWGHAVGSDMVHWTQLSDAIEPNEIEHSIWSGSAIVDWNNTAGFQTGDEKTLVAMYTAAGKPFAQCLTYSNDRGRTWTKFAANPVLPNIHRENRDPKLVWYEPAKKWVVALYLDDEKHIHDYGLFTSPDLKHWTPIQTVAIPDAAECPDFFPMNLDGDPSKQKWVMTGANGRYLVGLFDGNTFEPDDQKSKQVEFGANCYAVQTFSDIPKSDGRRIQIGWMVDGKYPGMPFNQQMSFPCELTLRSTPDAGLRLYKYPIKEIELLHGSLHEWKNQTLQPGDDLLGGLTGDCFDVSAEIEPGDNNDLTLNVRGTPIEFSTESQKLANGKLARIKLRVLIDRTSIEEFSGDGAISISRCFVPKAEDRSITLECKGSSCRIVSLNIYEMKSMWGEK